MEIVGRKAYIDWGDSIIAIVVYKKGYVPKNVKFNTPKEEAITPYLSDKNIPKVFDLVDYDGEIMEMNPQDTAMPHFYGHDVNQYIHDVFWTKKDQENENQRLKEAKEKIIQENKKTTQQFNDAIKKNKL